MMGGCCPNPFERLQYIRGTENFYMDLMFPTKGMLAFFRRLHRSEERRGGTEC